MKIRAEWFIAGLLAIAPPASAELADRDKPVNIEADRVNIEDARRTAIYEGNVVLTQGTLKLTARRLEVRQDEQGFSSGDAVGAPAHFRQKMEGSALYVEGWAEHIEYDGRAEKIKLTGKAHLKRGEEELRGHLIVYDGKTEFYRAEGGADGKPGRVRAVILPKNATSKKP
jgi:lipopolysaccharide export system protein LptA